MSTESFALRGTDEPDNDGVALNGAEVQNALKRDLAEMVRQISARLAEHPDLRAGYAYPRCRWEIVLRVVPYWSDEKPIEIEAAGGSGDGVQSDPIELKCEQPIVSDPDRLRPGKQVVQPEAEEKASQLTHPNRMVRKLG